MPSEPLWLPLDVVIAANERLVDKTGEPHFLRDRGGLESALAVPQNLYVYKGESDVVRLAISLLFAIARKQVFLQGNKRTALAAAAVFMEANGYMIAMANTEWLADWILAVLDGRKTPEEFEHALKPYIAELPDES